MDAAIAALLWMLYVVVLVQERVTNRRPLPVVLRYCLGIYGISEDCSTSAQVLHLCQ